MNISGIIEELKRYPEESLLYNAGCYPNWVQGNNGDIVLSMEPVPVQRVKDLLNTLYTIQQQDLPNQDIAFRRRIYPDTELHMTSAFERNGQHFITVEIITTATIKLWFNHANDSMPVNVMVGHPYYILMGNQLKVLVNKPYWDALGNKGRLEYLDRLMSPKSFHYIEDGKDVFFNTEDWTQQPDPDLYVPSYPPCNKPKEPLPKPQPLPRPLHPCPDKPKPGTPDNPVLPIIPPNDLNNPSIIPDPTDPPVKLITVKEVLNGFGEPFYPRI